MAGSTTTWRPAFSPQPLGASLSALAGSTLACTGLSCAHAHHADQKLKVKIRCLQRRGYRGWPHPHPTSASHHPPSRWRLDACVHNHVMAQPNMLLFSVDANMLLLFSWPFLWYDMLHFSVDHFDRPLVTSPWAPILPLVFAALAIRHYPGSYHFIPLTLFTYIVHL